MNSYRRVSLDPSVSAADANPAVGPTVREWDPLHGEVAARKELADTNRLFELVLRYQKREVLRRALAQEDNAIAA